MAIPSGSLSLSISLYITTWHFLENERKEGKKSKWRQIESLIITLSRYLGWRSWLVRQQQQQQQQLDWCLDRLCNWDDGCCVLSTIEAGLASLAWPAVYVASYTVALAKVWFSNHNDDERWWWWWSEMTIWAWRIEKAGKNSSISQIVMFKMAAIFISWFRVLLSGRKFCCMLHTFWFFISALIWAVFLTFILDMTNPFYTWCEPA